MSDYKAMCQLGLNRTAIDCYEKLYQDGWATAGVLAKRLDRPRSSVYYALRILESQGFVERRVSNVLPEVTHFRAVRLDKALENLAVYQRRAVRKIIAQQIERSIKQQVHASRPTHKDWR